MALQFTQILAYQSDADESPRVSYHDARDVERVAEQIRQTGREVVVMRDGEQWDPATGKVSERKG